MNKYYSWKLAQQLMNLEDAEIHHPNTPECFIYRLLKNKLEMTVSEFAETTKSRIKDVLDETNWDFDKMMYHMGEYRFYISDDGKLYYMFYAE